MIENFMIADNSKKPNHKGLRRRNSFKQKNPFKNRSIDRKQRGNGNYFLNISENHLGGFGATNRRQSPENKSTKPLQPYERQKLRSVLATATSELQIKPDNSRLIQNIKK